MTAKSPALQGEQIVVTDSAGLYRLAQLPAGEYTIGLEKESYKPFSRGEITVRTDRTVRVNIQVQPEAVQSEQIVVVARPPTVDVSSTTSGIVVGKEFINNIAFIRPSATGVRSFESLASVAPQVASDRYGSGMSGATSPENRILIDGFSVNDPGFGTNATALPVDFIQEANIITGGYMAEYGRAGGGVINAITKSGSNEFHGSVFGNYTPGLLSPSSPAVITGGSARVVTNKVWNIADFGAELGGPIIKDRLWFYVGVSPSFSRNRRTQYLNDVTTSQKVDGSDIGVFDDRRSLSYIAKLTFLVNADNNISLSVNGNSNDRHLPAYGNQNESAITPVSGTVWPDSSINASLKYSGGFLDKHLLVDVQGGWFHQTSAPVGLPDDGSGIGSTTGAASIPSLILWDQSLNITDLEKYPASVVAACAPLADGRRRCPGTTTASAGRYFTGGFGLMQNVVNDRFTGRANLTYLLSALGHHVFKAGVDFERSVYGITKAQSGGVTIQQAQDGQSYFDIRQYAYLTGPDQMTIIPKISIAPSTNQLGGFVQDSWSIFDLVTLNVGVRYDNQQLYDGDGKLGMALNNMWSPRIGAIYDFTNQGRSKIFANYARYHFSMPLDLADRALSGENQAAFNRLSPCDPVKDPTQIHSGACTNPANFGINDGSPFPPSRFAQVTGQGKTAIDPNLQAGSKDEIVVGGEYEVLSDMRLGATYTKSWTNRIIEDMSNDEANTYFIGNPGYGIASSFPKATRNYQAVTVVATKALSDGWMGQLSYTWSELRGNWAGYFRPETNQLDPGINSDFDLKSLLANREGPLPGDRTHFIKAYAAKEFIIGSKTSFQLGVTYEGSSGTPISYLGRHIIYGPGEVFILPRGSAGRTPWVHTFNVRLGVTYRIDKDLGVTFAVDGLNVFNFAAVTTVDQNYTTARVLPYVAQSGENAIHSICADGSLGCQPQVVRADTGGKLASANFNPNFKNPANSPGVANDAYQLPMQWRFSIKFTF